MQLRTAAVNTIITMNTIMNIKEFRKKNGTGILRLMQAFDSLFPVGAFTMSNGMETYTQKGLVCSKDTLCEFLRSYLYTMRTCDLGFAAKAASGEDVRLLDEICTASKIPSELREGSRKLCIRFIKAQKEIGVCKRIQDYSELISDGICTGHYSVASGLFIADSGADIKTGLQMFCYSQLSAMVNHAVKLVPLRQNDGQIALASVIEMIPDAVSYALGISTDDLGISGAGFELRSMQHEKLYSRIYIS